MTLEEARATAISWTGEHSRPHDFRRISRDPDRNPGYEFVVPDMPGGTQVIVTVDGRVNRVLEYRIGSRPGAERPPEPAHAARLTAEQARSRAVAFLAARGVDPAALGLTLFRSEPTHHVWAKQLPTGVWLANQGIVVSTRPDSGLVQRFERLDQPLRISGAPLLSEGEALQRAARAAALIYPGRYLYAYLCAPVTVATDFAGEQYLLWSVAVIASDDAARKGGPDAADGGSPYLEVMISGHTGRVAWVVQYLGFPGREDVAPAVTALHPRFRRESLLSGLRGTGQRTVLHCSINGRLRDYGVPHWRGNSLFWNAGYLGSPLFRATVHFSGDRLHVTTLPGRRAELRLGQRWMMVNGKRVTLRHTPYREHGTWYLPAECWTRLTDYQFRWRPRHHTVELVGPHLLSREDDGPPPEGSQKHFISGGLGADGFPGGSPFE